MGTYLALGILLNADKQIRRPFAFINSRIYVHAAEGSDARLVGEAQQSVPSSSDGRTS